MLVQRPESLSATLTRTAKIPPGMMLAIAKAPSPALIALRRVILPDMGCAPHLRLWRRNNERGRPAAGALTCPRPA